MSEQAQSETVVAVNQLVNLLQYQNGSIVSRVLLKNKGGTVTLFAFDNGEGLSEHTAPFDALVVVVAGHLGGYELGIPLPIEFFIIFGFHAIGVCAFGLMYWSAVCGCVFIMHNRALLI